MASGLQQTKRRINSVNSTKKITNAMRLVSTAKLKSWKKRLAYNGEYADSLHSLMNMVIQSLSEEERTTFFGKDENKGTLYIVVTSTLGLCGGYNYNLYKEVVPLIDKEKDEVLVIGTKGLSYFKRNGYKVNDKFVTLASNYDVSEIRKIRNEIMSHLQMGQVSQIKMAYTHFKNSITFIPTVIDIYPIQEDKDYVLTNKEKNMLIEPNAQTILTSLIPLYLESLINSYIIESSVSEFASRSNAMESATDNATDIINKLQIQFNKARQQSITQEITEVVGGANAQS